MIDNSYFTGTRRQVKIMEDTSRSSTTTSISTRAIENIIERLRYQNNRKSTKRTYYNIWRQFNHFYIRLNQKPKSWEDRLLLFVGYLVENNRQSSTIKSYISAIRSVLQDDGVTLNKNKFLLTALTKACKLTNDHVYNRFPIQKEVLKILLKTTKDYFSNKGQIYLAKMYSALFVSAYFGLLRVSELTAGSHAILAKKVHIVENKDKIQFKLESSKTHLKDKHPQLVKISNRAIKSQKMNTRQYGFRDRNHICAFSVISDYL